MGLLHRFRLFVAVLLVFVAVLAWQLGGLPKDSLSAMPGVTWGLAACFVLVTFLSWRYFFILPAGCDFGDTCNYIPQASEQRWFQLRNVRDGHAGYSEFPPELGNESKFPYVRDYQEGQACLPVMTERRLAFRDDANLEGVPSPDVDAAQC